MRRFALSEFGFGKQQVGFQGGEDTVCYLILNDEKVFELAVIFFRPDMVP